MYPQGQAGQLPAGQLPPQMFANAVEISKKVTSKARVFIIAYRFIIEIVLIVTI